MTLLEETTACLRIPTPALARLSVEGSGRLLSAFPVNDFAAHAIGAAGIALGQLREEVFGGACAITVDRRLASLWFGMSIQPIAWDLPSAWDAIAGDYVSVDGWIRLHTNAPKHRAAALRVLRCVEDRAAVTTAVARWTSETLEAAIVHAGGCAAQMRSCNDWKMHPQGNAVANEPLIAFSSSKLSTATFAFSQWKPSPDKPLAGLKILDLTRVLAGPVATRFLAGYGADVLRIDPPDWDEPGLIPEVTLGKRCVRLDLRNRQDRDAFEGLLSEADVVVHGYRPNALDKLGYSAATRRAINPGVIDVCLNAYGWTGPWHERRGFDSLLQMSSGIAHLGMAWKQVSHPVPLPVQAIDHATGYLMAAAVIRSLHWRITENKASTAKLSLARTAHALISLPRHETFVDGGTSNDADVEPTLEQTDWGLAKRLRSPLSVGGNILSWRRPASRLGSTRPEWDASPAVF